MNRESARAEGEARNQAKEAVMAEQARQKQEFQQRAYEDGVRRHEDWKRSQGLR